MTPKRDNRTLTDSALTDTTLTDTTLTDSTLTDRLFCLAVALVGLVLVLAVLADADAGFSPTPSMLATPTVSRLEVGATGSLLPVRHSEWIAGSALQATGLHVSDAVIVMVPCLGAAAGFLHN
ncbi:MAG: hypothetical protein JXQ75_22565 [Phycisphaerae bacterium]|nr:hypothetical protein [Phycisphaerae bacterium]